MSVGRRGVRVFSALVRLLLPRDLRERAEAGIVEVFAARLTEARTSGVVAGDDHNLRMIARLATGVRVALGARQSVIAGMVVRHGLRLAAIGIACGCLGGLVAAKVLASLLYDTSPLDPPTFVVVALALAACAAIATMAPSLRAARVDPLIALGNE